MKKKIFSILLAVCLTASVPVTGYASDFSAGEEIMAVSEENMAVSDDEASQEDPVTSEIIGSDAEDQNAEAEITFDTDESAQKETEGNF